MESKTLWAGRIMSALPVLLLLFSAALKLARPASTLQAMARYGYPEHLLVAIGLLELFCTLVYLVPQTSILGAILLTGYLGGATATNVRVGDPAGFLTVLLGILVWGGLYLRDERLRALIPLRGSR
jgi:hypothetical protein